MKRREFISLVGGAAACPLAARAQQAGKLPTIGFVGSNASAWGAWTAAFVARLHDLGWIEGRTVRIEYRWSEGRPERIAEIAAEFVRRNVDIIVTNDSSAATIKQATSVIPIVFVLGNDPLGTGLVTNLARPGGNVTGLSVQQTETDSKRLELLREVVPRLRRVAVVANFGNPSSVRQTRELQAAADALGVEVVPLEIRRADDIASAFAALNAQADALYIVQDALAVASMARIMTFALTARLPTIVYSRDFVSFGALMSYGTSYPALFRRTADLVDKILRGTKPGDIPVEQPTKFELVINLTTAKALGITVPSNVLAIADECKKACGERWPSATLAATRSAK
jgi:putative tryptophan/tyrosine transport system substrate-binding protein